MTSDLAPTAGRLALAPHACFACGELSEHGMHLVLHVDGASSWTELKLPAAFQGWEGIAHGGIVATILDEVMAWALASADAWAVTARMTVEFRRPVVVGRRIRGEGRLVERRHRLLSTAGRLIDAETGAVLATAEGTYVEVPEKRKRELQERYRFRAAAADDPPGGVDGGTPAAGASGPRGAP